MRSLTGTLINTAAVLGGGLLGTFVVRNIPERFRELVMKGIGLAVVAIGLGMALRAQSPIVIIVSVAAGAALGEALDLDGRLGRLGRLLEARFGGEDGRFARGFVTASLVFCVGPMTITGAIQDALTGRYDILAAKSALDAVGAVVFASALGVGVLFSAATVLVYQGGISLLAGLLSAFLTPSMIGEMTAAGGLLILGIGIQLLEVGRLRVANLLPALAVSPALVAIAERLGRWPL